MKRTAVSRVLFCALPLLRPLTAIATITIATAPVGNPGNPNDPFTGSQYGNVPYSYSIGKYDVFKALNRKRYARLERAERALAALREVI